MLAARGGYDGIAAALLDGGADPSCSDQLGRTAAHYALDGGHQETAEALQDAAWKPPVAALGTAVGGRRRSASRRSTLQSRGSS